MAISRFYKKTVSTQRLSTVSGSKRESFQANLVTLSCAIHPLSPEKALVGGEAFYNVFKLFCGVSEDILVGDRIIDGTDTYTVQSIASYDDVSSENNYKSVIIVKGL